MSDKNQYSEQAQQAQHLQYTPEPQRDAHVEARVEVAVTQVVTFDPFVNEDDEQEPGTAAATFDPFVDDDNDDEELGITELLGHGGSSSSVTTHPGTQTPDPSMASCRKALEDFHRRRSNARCERTAADGTVYLPYITTQGPRDTVVGGEKIRVTNRPAPSLKADDTVADQYETVGPIVHGGLGWIYLTIDRNASDRQVVLKGMMAAKSGKDSAIVQAERELLAEIPHPGTVEVISFIDETGANSAIDFIVMEYVGGSSLRKQQRSYPDGVMPCDLATDYVLELPPALDYPHPHGVVYSDLKLDNVLLSGDHVMLIDVGVVIDTDTYGRIHGTPGFQALEIATTGPTIASDTCTVGRTLTSLILELPATNDVYDPGLLLPVEEPLFRRFHSLYHSLLRVCHENLEARSGSTEEMSVQLIGVLRETPAIRGGMWFPQTVSNFLPQCFTYGTKYLVLYTDQFVGGIIHGVETTPQEVTFALPIPLINPTDPGACISSASSLTESNELTETLTNALPESEYGSSMEIPLDIMRVKLGLGLINEARDSLCDVPERSQRD